MKKELELQLVEKYPDILKEYGGDVKETCMGFGIDVGDGWYKLIDDMFAKLETIKHFTGVGVVAKQIKEKFGILRFYYSIVDSGEQSVKKEHVHDIIDMIISHFEKISRYNCEVTGGVGTLCSRVGWLKVLCKEEADKSGYVPTDPNMAKKWDDLDNESVKKEI